MPPENTLNLTMPGNPRYQPKDLRPYFGHDRNPAHFVARVELATLETLGDRGIIPPEVISLLTPGVKEAVEAITTTEMEDRERKVTKHDIRAWVQLAQERMDPQLARFVHIPLTSYDALDTARTLQYQQSYQEVVRPMLGLVIEQLAIKVEQTAVVPQIGRTHGQAALPITVGFWLSTILGRLTQCYLALEVASELLVGKISGAVGARNAQIGLGLQVAGGPMFDVEVLARLGLSPARISTQILPPEPLANYLFQVVLTSGALGQLGRDCRHLMRSEIGEVREGRQEGAAGSSTMAHKTNPINFEQLEGRYLASRNEVGKVLDTVISDHQRDLVGSSLMRDFPIIVINLVTQLGTLLRQDQEGRSFLQRIEINVDALKANLAASANLILAEPLYLALQMAGFEADAHRLVADVATPAVKEEMRLCHAAGEECKLQLIEVLEAEAESDPELAKALANIGEPVRQLLRSPERYTGDAAEQALALADYARSVISA